jgi:protein SCO1/2
MTSSSFVPAILTLTLLLATPLLAEGEHCHGHDSHGQHAAPETADPTRTVDVGEMSIPDVTLLDQDGEEVHFYTDLVEGRVVVVNFVFTTCTTICPPMGANFAKLQRLLGDRAGSEVEMISVSVDPAVDTPGRLKEWGDRFGREEGWTLVTGTKPDVDRLLKALKVFTPDKDDHSPIVLLGDDAEGRWTRAYGLAAPAQLAGMLDELLNDDADEAAVVAEAR